MNTVGEIVKVVQIVARNIHLCPGLRVVRFPPTSVSVTKCPLAVLRKFIVTWMRNTDKDHEVSSQVYSVQRQRQLANPNIRNNRDTNANPRVKNVYFRLKPNGTLRDVYIKI